MSKTWLALFLIAGAAVLIVCFVYGWAAVTFPILLVLGFFGAFSLIAVNASIQASANPGLEKLEEPDYWLSGIYNAWLYVTDRENWASDASLWSYLLGAFLGSIFGIIILFFGNVTFSLSIASWLSGMFLALSIAILVATSDYWSKTEEHDSGYEGEQESNSSFS
jgi:MFS family permease